MCILVFAIVAPWSHSQEMILVSFLVKEACMRINYFTTFILIYLKEKIDRKEQMASPMPCFLRSRHCG